MIRRIVPFVLVCALSGACGPSNAGDVTPESYAEQVCTALQGWQLGVTQDSERLSRALQARGADLATVRARYSAFFAAAVRRTDTLLASVDKAGAPEADDGIGYARDLSIALRQVRTGLVAAQQRFARLGEDNLSAYTKGAARIRDDLGRVLLGVGQSLDHLNTTYSDRTLNEAFADEPECRSLSR